MPEPIVEPLDPAAVPPQAPVVEPETPAQPDAATGQPAGLPEEVVQIPAFQGLLAGSPPAVTIDIKKFDNRPEGKVIADNIQELQGAGFALYRSLSGSRGVIFNQMYVHPEDIQAADKAGKLDEIAPPFDSVNDQLSKAGQDHPALVRGNVPGGFAGPAAKAPPQAGNFPMTPSPQAGQAGEATKKIMQARLNAANPGAPTSGPAPGAGRLLNSILKPVV